MLFTIHLRGPRKSDRLPVARRKPQGSEEDLQVFRKTSLLSDISEYGFAHVVWDYCKRETPWT
jgi:hypothetical protein